MSQSTCKADAGLYAFNPSIPLVRSHSSHSREVRKRDICVERGKKAEQTGEGAEDSGLQQEHKTQLTGELLVFQGRECKEGRAESAGGIREVGANSKIVEERECVSTGSWESFKLNLQSNHQMSEARILHSSNSQGTKRDRHINRFQGFGFECIFTHTPLHKSQLDLQNSTELKQA